MIPTLPEVFAVLTLKLWDRAASESKPVIIQPFSLGEKGRLWILDPIQVAFEVATRMRAKKLIVLGTFPLPNFDNTDSSEITTDSISKWLEKEPDLPLAQKIQLTALIEVWIRGVERCHFWTEVLREHCLRSCLLQKERELW